MYNKIPRMLAAVTFQDISILYVGIISFFAFGGFVQLRVPASGTLNRGPEELKSVPQIGTDVTLNCHTNGHYLFLGRTFLLP